MLSPPGCIALYRTKSLTIDLDADLERSLDPLCQRSGRKSGQTALDAVRRQLLLARFEQLRQRVMPFAEAPGLPADKDVCEQIL